MPYSITTKDGITIQNIPDDVAPDAQSLKDRVAAIRAGNAAAVQKPEPSLMDRAGDLFTGNLRKTAETEALPDWAGMPELNDLVSVAGWKTAIGTLMSGPEETAKIIKANYPGVEVRQDANGNFVLKSASDGKEYAIKPGFQVSDIPRFIGGLAAFTPSGRATSILGAAGASAATQGAIEATQAGAGGEFNPEDVAISGLAGAVAPALSKGVQAVKAMASPASPAAANILSDVAAAEARGIPVMTTDVVRPQTFMGKSAQALGERVPIIGTGGMRAGQNESRIEAVKSLLREFGASDVANVSDDVMADLAKTRGDALTKFARNKAEVIDRLATAGAVPVPKAIKAVDDQIAELSRNKTNEQVASVISDLEAFKKNIQGKDLKAIELERKLLGEKYKSPDLASVKDLATKVVDKIYGPLRDDMGDFIKSNGRPPDFAKWAVANKQLSTLAEEGKSVALRSVLKKGTQRPEEVEKLLFSSRPSDVKALYRALSSDGRARARVAILSKAAKDAHIDTPDGPSISPEKFATSVAKLGRSIGVFFNGEELRQVNGLVKALKMTRQASEAGVKTKTGQEAAPYAAGITLATFFGPQGALGAAVGIGGMARAYESAPVRNALIKLANAPKGSQEEAALAKHVRTLIQAQVSAQESKQ